MKSAENEVTKLKEKISNLIQTGEMVDEGFNSDLSTIMEDNTDDVHKAFPEGTFRRIFWDQQMENVKKNDPRQYRWHPLMIKWYCIGLSG